MPLNATEAIVLLALADSANDDGYCYPGYESLMNKSKVSRATLAKTLSILEGAGFFTKKSHAEIGEGRKVNTYYLEFDDSWFEIRPDPKTRKDKLTLKKSIELELIEKIKTLREGKKQTISSGLKLRKVQSLNSKSLEPEHEPSVITVSKEPLNIYSEQEEKDEPAKNKKLSQDEKLLLGYGVAGQLAKDFIKHRKAKKAAITATAMDGISMEAEKAGLPVSGAIAFLINAGWQGFKAEWYFDRQQKSLSNPQRSHSGLTQSQRGNYGGNNSRKQPISQDAWWSTDFLSPEQLSE
jgi:hypothetical protein